MLFSFSFFVEATRLAFGKGSYMRDNHAGLSGRIIIKPTLESGYIIWAKHHNPSPHWSPDVKSVLSGGWEVVEFPDDWCEVTSNTNVDL